MNMKIFFEAHAGIPREGPGSNESTRRAFEKIPNLPKQPRILDIGCGPGAQTIQLAKLSNGHVIGVDNHQPFLDRLAERVRIENLTGRIEAVNESMFELHFQEESFDLIWAEGCIYILGLETGLTNWKKFLKPGGYIAVTHISWLKENPPQEPLEFWNEGYPGMKNVEENIKVIKGCGYKCIDYFILPESDWLENYYSPLEKRIAQLRLKYADDQTALAVLEQIEREIILYKKYCAWYGYVFYIMQKP